MWVMKGISVSFAKAQYTFKQVFHVLLEVIDIIDVGNFVNNEWTGITNSQSFILDSIRTQKAKMNIFRGIRTYIPHLTPEMPKTSRYPVITYKL